VSSVSAQPQASLTFGYVSPGPDTWYQRDVDGFKYAAKQYGVKVVVLNSQYDQQKEIQNIQSLVNQGVDGISPWSTRAWTGSRCSRSTRTARSWPPSRA
jgi:ABC-type sugar transport system substrate-binding protein